MKTPSITVPRRPDRFWETWDRIAPQDRRPFQERLVTWHAGLWAELDAGPVRQLDLKSLAGGREWRGLLRTNEPVFWDRLERHDSELFAQWTSPEHLSPMVAGEMVQTQADRHMEWLIGRGFIRPGVAQDELGQRLAWRAASQGWLPGLRLLHQHGLTGHERFEKGRTLAHAAVYGQHVAVLDLLREWGSDIHAKDEQGHDALYTWALFCQREGRDTLGVEAILPWVEALMERGFAPEAPTGKTNRSRSFIAWAQDQAKAYGNIWGTVAQCMDCGRQRQILTTALESDDSPTPEKRRVRL